MLFLPPNKSKVLNFWSWTQITFKLSFAQTAISHQKMISWQFCKDALVNTLYNIKFDWSKCHLISGRSMMEFKIHLYVWVRLIHSEPSCATRVISTNQRELNSWSLRNTILKFKVPISFHSISLKLAHCNFLGFMSAFLILSVFACTLHV